MKTRAEDFLSELANDPDYQSRIAESNKSRADFEEQLRGDEADLVAEINGLGFSISSVWDLVNSENNYLEAIPILKRHLERDHHPRILAGVVRALAVEDLKEDQELWNSMIERYRKAEPDRNLVDPDRKGYQEAIAVCLSALATKGRTVELNSLLDDEIERDGELLIRKQLHRLGT